MKQIYKIAVDGKIYTVIAYDDDGAKKTVIEHTEEGALGKPFTLARIGVAGADHTCGVIGVEDDHNPDQTITELLRLAFASVKK